MHGLSLVHVEVAQKEVIEPTEVIIFDSSVLAQYKHTPAISCIHFFSAGARGVLEMVSAGQIFALYQGGVHGWSVLSFGWFWIVKSGQAIFDVVRGIDFDGMGKVVPVQVFSVEVLDFPVDSELVIGGKMVGELVRMFVVKEADSKVVNGKVEDYG